MRIHRGKLLVYLLLGIFSLVAFVPFLLTWFTAFKTNLQLIKSGPFSIPDKWHWENFVEVWIDGNFQLYFLNSVKILVPVLFFSVVLSIMSGYAFARWEFLGKRILFLVLLIGIWIPIEVLMIALFYFLKDLRLLNTLWAIILPDIGLGVSFGTLVMRSYFKGIPQEIIDSAVVDGASSWQVLWRILVPISKPAITALIIFFSIWTWNDFLFPLVFLSDVKLYPLTLGLYQYQGTRMDDIPMIMMGVSIVITPLVVIYAFLQREFIKGLTQGAIR